MWTWESKLEDPYEKQIYKKIFNLTKSKSLALKASKNLGLFEFLKKNKFSTSKELQESIFLKPGKKLFDEKQSKTVWEFFNTAPEQKGGEEPSPPKAENAFDALVERWLVFMYHLLPGGIQESIKYVEPFMFPLSEKPGQEGIVTKMPGVGLGLNFALDVVAQNNKLAAKLAQQYTPMIMGLVPIPEASTVGIIIGYMISTMFIFFNMLVFVSKREFGQAFTQSLALFPFIGLAMQNVAESGEKVIEKFASKRQKLIGQLKGSDGQGMFAFLGDLIENYTFDPLYEGDPAQDALALKQKLEGKFTEISGNLRNALDPEKRGELLNQAQQKFQELKANPRLQSLKTKAQESLEKLKADPRLQTLKEKARTGLEQLKANPQLQGLREKAQEKFNKFTQRAGKRLSKKKHKNKKWKTQRKLNK
jgi:hypothetical protein